LIDVSFALAQAGAMNVKINTMVISAKET